jgi:Domain of unknown function (DUF4835)
MRKIFVGVLVMFFALSQAQELNCVVTFNTDQVTGTNLQVFKTLEKSLTEFLNNTKWSTQKYNPSERIECSFNFIINSFSVDQFTSSLQVQASRPVYNSTYATPILNINDKEVDFTYLEFQNFTFDPNSFDSNLVSVVAFYANMIIGVDGDTFAEQGGSKALENAQNIVNIAQQSQSKGWSQTKGNQNRYFLVNDMLSNAFAPFRKAMFEYHFRALDIMSDNQKEAKDNIVMALKTLEEINAVRPNAYLTRVFIDAKADEIVSIFSGGPSIDLAAVIEILNRLSPTNSSKWGQIRF